MDIKIKNEWVDVVGKEIYAVDFLDNTIKEVEVDYLAVDKDSNGFPRITIVGNTWCETFEVPAYLLNRIVFTDVEAAERALTTERLITRANVEKAYDDGRLKLVRSFDSTGTLAKIGVIRIHFGGMTAEEENPDEYVRHCDRAEMLDDIFASIDNFAHDSAEYRTMAAILS